jgi:hypothetical protein
MSETATSIMAIEQFWNGEVPAKVAWRALLRDLIKHPDIQPGGPNPTEWLIDALENPERDYYKLLNDIETSMLRQWEGVRKVDVPNKFELLELVSEEPIRKMMEIAKGAVRQCKNCGRDFFPNKRSMSYQEFHSRQCEAAYNARKRRSAAKNNSLRPVA